MNDLSNKILEGQAEADPASLMETVDEEQALHMSGKDTDAKSNRSVCTLASKSRSSHTSHRTEITRGTSVHNGSSGQSLSLVIKARAKAAAAVKQIEFLKKRQQIIAEEAEMEAAIAAKQAGLDAENKARQVKTEATLATLAQVAKAEVLQVTASVLEQGLLGNTSPPDVTTEDPVTKVDSYLNTHIINIAVPPVLTRESAVVNNSFVSQPEITEVSAPKEHYLPSTEVTSQAAVPLHDISQTKLEQSLPVDTQDSIQSNYTVPTTAFSLNPKAPSWVPENPQIQTNSEPTLHQSSVPLDVLNYTFYRNPRRDLADRGIQKFSDKPEDYMLWKNTFQSALKQLKLPVVEELNLLIAWLGPASSIQVKRIYAANINNPHAALNRVWVRLNEHYGSSAQIETLLLQNLKSFPAFTKGEYEKLWDYADLLEELEAAKGNPDLPGLACLDQYLSVTGSRGNNTCSSAISLLQHILLIFSQLSG
nr:PREDICTED: uncharacterized protein LOC107983647 [Anolis carolinensis]|eukprot:XP_016853561.1 PREDICTED: uncharacterized protein LOC107983647 [Anolis carolinensis]